MNISSYGGTEGNLNIPAPPPEAPSFETHASALQDSAGESGPGNIDKIRDILFGSNMREYEQRFARLEEALKKESSDLRESTRHHLESLEAFVKKELAALDVRLNAERQERSESQSRLTSEISNTSSAIFRKIGEIENQEAQAMRDVRNDLLQQSKELTEAIRNKGEELVALLDRRAHELQLAKTDRAALAGLFNEVALRLTDQFKVTSAGQS